MIASWSPNRFHGKPFFGNDMKVRIVSGAARIEALTVTGQPMWRKTWSYPQPRSALRSNADWHTTCNVIDAHQDEMLMFKITQNTIKAFTLAEILLMAAMNEIEAKRRTSSTASNPERTS